MIKKLTNIIACSFFISSLSAQVQALPVNDDALGRKYSFVRTVYNRISNGNGLDSFYKKLYGLKNNPAGTVSIVHIGDSHIQPDFISSMIRNGLQDFFGNAGRGLVFPQQLAQSNAPDDISASSNVQWQFNRLAHPEIKIPYGISGYGLKTDAAAARINLSLRPAAAIAFSFDRIKIFADSITFWKLETGDKDYILKKEQGDSSMYLEAELAKASSSFFITALSGNTKEFYGASLEKSSPGIIYHTIGVNGARYDHYNAAELFWKQLPALHADLYIVSLGTNEAQAAAFDENAFTKELESFIEKLKQASPGAAILITTAPDSYKKKRFNTTLRKLNTFLAAYCSRNQIPLWDLYRISNGYGSAYSWAKRGLMNRDRLHFTADGYKLQGRLLLAALSKGYNAFGNSYSPD